MKLKNYFLLFFVIFSFAAFGQDQKLKISADSTDVKEIFKEIKTQSGLTFIYNEEDIKQIKPVTIKARSITVKEALESCLRDSGLTWVINDGVIIIRQQEEEKKNDPVNRSISGTITISETITDKVLYLKN